MTVNEKSSSMIADTDYTLFDVGDDTEWSDIYSSSDSMSSPPTSPLTSPPVELENELSAEAAKWKRLYEEKCEELEMVTKQRDEALEENTTLKLEAEISRQAKADQDSPANEQTTHPAPEENTEREPLDQNSAAEKATQETERPTTTQTRKKREQPKSFKRPPPGGYARPPKEDDDLQFSPATTNPHGQKRKLDDRDDVNEPTPKRPAHPPKNVFSNFFGSQSKPVPHSSFVGPKTSASGRVAGSMPYHPPWESFGGKSSFFAEKGIFGVSSPSSAGGAAPKSAQAASSPLSGANFCFGGTTANKTAGAGSDASRKPAVPESQRSSNNGEKRKRSSENASDEPAAKRRSAAASSSEPSASQPVFGKPSPFSEGRKSGSGMKGGGFSGYTKGSGFPASTSSSDTGFSFATGSTTSNSNLGSSKTKPTWGSPYLDPPMPPRPVNGLDYVAACRHWLEDAKKRIANKTIINFFAHHPVHTCERLGLEAHGHDCAELKRNFFPRGCPEGPHQLQQVFDTLASFNSPGNKMKWLKEERRVWHSDKFTTHSGSIELKEQLNRRIDDVFSAIGSVIDRCKAA